MSVNPIYQYRIQWKSKITGFISWGNWFDSKYKNNLEKEITRLNKEYNASIYHWLEKNE